MTAKPEPDSLEPCPLGCAGGELHPHVCEWERPGAWQTYCQRCLVSTRVHDSKENAVADWNRRPARLESLRGAPREIPDGAQAAITRGMNALADSERKEDFEAWKVLERLSESLRGAEPKGGERLETMRAQMCVLQEAVQGSIGTFLANSRGMESVDRALERWIKDIDALRADGGRVPSWTQEEADAIELAVLDAEVMLAEERPARPTKHRLKCFATLKRMLSRQPKAETPR